VPVAFGAEHPRTLREEWRGAAIMREAYAPREGSDVPVPMNPFRQNRSAADYKLAAEDARWPAEAAKRDPIGTKAMPLPERSALAAARDAPAQPPAREATRVEVPSPVVAAPEAAAQAHREEERKAVAEAVVKALGEPAPPGSTK
jgi:hypothetical protein